MRIITATRNQGKIKELSNILGDIGIDIVSLEQLGIDKEVVEDGETFEDNAIKKALEICELCDEPVLADDSGLEVDYLDGQPGVYSARFSGEDATPAKNNEKLLKLLKDVPKEKRTARFVCVTAVAFPNGRIITSRGECEGIIIDELKGEGGFGYDPLFYYPQLNKTFAQLSKEEKNKVSHRGRALEKLKEELKKVL